MLEGPDGTARCGHGEAHSVRAARSLKDCRGLEGRTPGEGRSSVLRASGAQDRFRAGSQFWTEELGAGQNGSWEGRLALRSGGNKPEEKERTSPNRGRRARVHRARLGTLSSPRRTKPEAANRGRGPGLACTGLRRYSPRAGTEFGGYSTKRKERFPVGGVGDRAKGWESWRRGVAQGKRLPAELPRAPPFPEGVL